MPIIGMTDRESLKMAFPQVGVLNKGAPKNKSSPGKDMPTFRFTGFTPGAQKAWDAAFPEPPESLRVYLAYPTADEAFPTYKAAFKASRMTHRCDGETTSLLYNESRRGYDKSPHKCPGGCVETGDLKVVIPELIEAGYVGPVILRTHAKWDCINLTSELLAAEQEASMAGADLKGIEFRLYKRYESKPSPGGGRQNHWLLHIAPEARWIQDRMREARAHAMGEVLEMDVRRVNPDTGEVTYERAETVPVVQKRITDGEVVSENGSDVGEQVPEVGQDPPRKADTIPEKEDRVQEKGPQAPSGKLATIKTGRWREAAMSFVAKSGGLYEDEKGNPLMVDILQDLAAAGYETLTEDNLDEGLNRLLDLIAGTTIAQETLPL